MSALKLLKRHIKILISFDEKNLNKINYLKQTFTYECQLFKYIFITIALKLL